MTPQQVEQAARRRYNSVDSTFWSQDEVFKLIYEAELILAKEALAFESTDSSIATVAGTRAYSFPSGVIGIYRIEYDGRKLEKTDFRDDDRLTLSNSTTTEQGTPQYYQIWNDTIYLRPIPDAVETLTLYTYEEPALLTTASSTLSVPSRFHIDLIEYVASIMAAKDENLRMAQFYEARWLDRVEKAKAWQKKRRRTDSFAAVKDEESLAQTLLGTV